jgi:group I intron endonuclease
MTPSMLFSLGFVFMFTIGGLINHLALPLNITICWELLTIILLIVTMYNFEASAGNQRLLVNDSQVGTSETTRDTHITSMRRDSPRKNSLIQSRFITLVDKKSTSISYTYKYYTTSTSITSLKPLTRYDNFKDSKSKIIKEQNQKTGIYCIINKINDHFYIGSSINLASRMKNYLSTSFLQNKSNANMPIIKALLKYDQSNFILLILEHVEAKDLLIRETYYITSLIPYYNVLKQAYSSLGYKHTEETKKMLIVLANNRVHSESTKGLIARALTGENNPFYNKSHSIESKVRMIEANSKHSLYVYNSYKQLLVIFPSILTFSKQIKSNHATIVSYIKSNEIFRGEWFVSNIPYNIEDKPSISN